MKLTGKLDYSTLKEGIQGMRFELQMRAGHTAASAGARKIKEQAIRNARAQQLEDTGALIENIAIAKMKARNNLTYFPYYIGVRHGGKKHKKTGRNPWYWWLWEFGWTDRAGNRHRRPFLVRAIKESQDVAYAAVRASLERTLKRAQKSWAKSG